MDDDDDADMDENHTSINDTRLDDITESEESSECPEEAEPLEVDVVTAPDGGWGWMIVIGSFITGVLVDGCAFTFGIIMIEMADYFQVSKMQISWAGSVMNGVYLSMGPLVSGMCNKWGCRPVALVGAAIACIGFGTCSLSENVYVLIVLYGLVGGIGFGMLYLPSIVMVGFYFEKKRATATGIAVCGSGMGAFIMAPIIEKLLDIYDWRGAQIILAGVILHGIAAAMLFRPLETKTEEEPDSYKPTNDINDIELSKSAVNNASSDDTADVQMRTHVPTRRHNSVSRPLSVEVVVPEGRDRFFTSLSELYTPRRQRSVSEAPKRKTDRMDFVRSCDESVFRRVDRNAQIALVDREDLKKDLLKPMHRKDIFYTGSVMNLPQYQVKGADEYHRSMTMVHVPDEDDANKCKCCHPDHMEILSSMVDLSLLRSYTFCLYGFSCVLAMAGFFVPFMFLPDDAMLKGISRDFAAILLSVIGAANTVGRVACGLVSDQPWADCLVINNVALVMGGVATLLVPFLDGNFPLLCIYSFIFGLSVAIFVSLRSILMVELIGLDKLTSAFGMVTLSQGISSFIGAPMAGAIYDVTGDYSTSFYVAGSMFILAGLICIPCRKVAAWEKRKLEEARGNR